MNKFPIDEVIKKLKRAKIDLPKILAEDALRFFNASFKKQGWEDSSLVKWKKRLYDRTPRDKSRPILIDTGAMRKAVKSSLKTATWERIEFKVDSDYAQYHNEGTARLPQRQFMGDSKKLREMQTKKIQKIIKQIWQR